MVRNSLLIALTALLGLSLTSCGSDKREPNIEYAPQMYHSIPLEPYKQIDANDILPRETNMAKPAEGTIARGKLDYFYPYPETNEGYELAGENITNPYQPTEEHLAKGKVLYGHYCVHCHGEKGDGKGIMVQKDAYAGVPSYYSPRLKDLPDGKKYHSIWYGRNMMGSHASQMSPKEIWQVIMWSNHLRDQGLGIDSPQPTDTPMDANGDADAGDADEQNTENAEMADASQN